MLNLILKKLQQKLRTDISYAFKNGSWLLAAHAISIIATLISSYVFANYLPPGVYGQYKYILTIGVALSVFSFTGASSAIVQAAAKGIAGFFTYMRSVNVYYSFVITFLATIGATYYYLQGNTQLALGLLIIAFLQPFFNNSSLIFAHLYGSQQFKIGTIGQSARAIFVTIVMVGSVLLTDNIFVLLLSYFISNASINYTLHYLYAPRKEVVTEIAAAKLMYRFGKHQSLQNIISGLSNQLDKVLIFQNLGALDLATYAFATALPDQYKTLTSAIETMLLPRFANQSDKSIKSNIFRKSVIYFFLLLTLMATYVIVAPFLYSFFYPQYASSVHLSQLYAVAMIFGIGGIPLTALKSRLSNRKLYHFNLITALFQILSLLLLIPLYGLMGAVISRIVYRGAVCISAYYLYYKV